MDDPRDGELIGDWYNRVQREAITTALTITRREGMIAGLERALAVGYPDKDCERRLRAEIDRLRSEPASPAGRR